MKKRYLFHTVWLAAGMLTTFASCSNEEGLVVPDTAAGIPVGDSQVLSLRVENTGNGLTTRAGRPLYGNDADQNIDYVALHFTKKQEDGNDYKLIRRIVLPWGDKNSGIKSYEDDGHGKKLELILNRCPQGKLGEGNYRIYAVGYSASSDYTLSPVIGEKEETDAMGTEMISDIIPSEETEWTDATFKATLKKDKTDAEEIFAGQMDICVGEEGGFALYVDGASRTPSFNTLTLHRQVAGVIGYFTNIPASVKVDEVPVKSRYLRLVSVNKNSEVKFGQFNSDFTGPNDGNYDYDKGNTEVDYIVNGGSPCKADATYQAKGEETESKEAHTLFTIDLTDWFPNLTDYNEDGFLGCKDVQDYLDAGNANYSAIWKNPHAEEASFVRGSVFSGKFVIPFEKGTESTLELQLLADEENGTQILKSWVVKMNKEQLHKGSSTDGTSWEKFDMDESHYNIYRNHAYNIGTKKSANPGGTDPEKPNDNDNPVDLSYQEVTITVEDTWDDVYDLELGYDDKTNE